MFTPVDVIKRIWHGKGTFAKGEIVTVRQPINAMHLVDRGMLSTSVEIPLMAGDRVSYLGPHVKLKDVFLIAEVDADKFVARVANEKEREWIDRKWFVIYVPIGTLARAE